MTRFWVDAWDPSYGPAVDGEFTGGGAPGRASTAELDLAVEMAAGAWAPVPAPADLAPPGTVLLVDGVRRVDARVWTAAPDGGAYPGLAASYAAGVVRCDLRRGVAGLAELRVERGLFTTSPTATDLVCGQVRYPVRRVGGRRDRPSPGGDLTGQAQAGARDPADPQDPADGQITDPAELVPAVMPRLTRLEAEVAEAARATADDRDDLLVLDGPLRGRRDLPRSIGYIKTHRSRYLPPAQTAVVTGLAPGQRSPVFQLGTSWQRYTWYLRLPGGPGAPWSGLVRVECPVELPRAAAVALADLSAVTLPRFASTPYKDPRAPQNLIPIAGLEQRLRARLGDVALLQRALARAAA